MQRKQGPHCCTLAYESGLQVDGLEGCKLTQGPMLSLHTLQTHYVQQYDLVLWLVWGAERLDNSSRPHSAGTAAWSYKAHPSRTAFLASVYFKRGSDSVPTAVMCCMFDLLPHRRWRAGSLRCETTAVLFFPGAACSVGRYFTNFYMTLDLLHLAKARLQYGGNGVYSWH